MCGSAGRGQVRVKPVEAEEVVGDRQYGAVIPPKRADDADLRTNEIALHAWRLTLKHPVRYDLVQIEAPLPDAWTRFGFVLPKGT